MATDQKRVIMPVGKFIDEFVISSQIPGAKGFFEEWQRGFPKKMWENFRGMAATENSIGGIIEGVAHKISLRLSTALDGEREQILENGRAFMQEICNCARENVAEDEMGTAPNLYPTRYIKIFDH